MNKTPPNKQQQKETPQNRRKILRKKTMQFKTDIVWKLFLATKQKQTNHPPTQAKEKHQHAPKKNPNNQTKSKQTKRVFKFCGSHGFEASSRKNVIVAHRVRNVMLCHFDTHDV